jgi:uncharacterized repeat protein (TIGR03803 family)
MKISLWLVLSASVCLFAATGFGQTVKEVAAFPESLSAYGGATTLTQGRDGRLYGITPWQGSTEEGSAFSLSTLGNLVPVHTFSGSDGSAPISGLTLALDGSLYGTASNGGTAGAGVLFKVTPAGVLTVLHSFTTGADGQFPPVAPILASDGNLYGVTSNGTVDDGTVYRYSPSGGTFTTIFSFSTDGSQGKQVTTALLQAANGNLYGTAQLGGAKGCGTIFELTTSGTLLHVFSFPCGAGGYLPTGALIQSSSGALYGTTALGGITSAGECAQGCGTIFTLNHGLVSVLYRFSGYPNDGGVPNAGLVEGTDGNLYGGTTQGGAKDHGTLYQISPVGQYKLLYSLTSNIGSAAAATLLQHTDGKFYGDAAFDGRYFRGSIYSLDMGLGPFIALVRYTGRIGQPVQILGQGLTGATTVTINGVAATSFKVASDTYMTAVVPTGATTGPVVVTTPKGMLTSNHNLRIVQ